MSESKDPKKETETDTTKPKKAKVQELVNIKYNKQ